MILFFWAPFLRDLANNPSKLHEDATTILCKKTVEDFGLPDVVKMWRLGVERVLKEVGANLVRIIRTSLNLSCILSRSRSFSS